MHAGVVEIYVGKDANLRFVELQSWGRHVWNFSHERAHVERGGNLDWIFGAVGSRLTKNFSDLDLAGQGAQGRMSGFYFTDGTQHLDHDTQQNHLAPNCTSDLLFKGALKGKSRSVWQGMIYVAPGAQKTDGYQANRNLVLDDQARAVRDVAARFPFVDGTRVGVFGWSFGGTMSLLALTRHPDVFRCGVAVAPVTDWRLYDTIYTERFMGTPEDNPIGYEATSLLESIGRLRGPMLVVHGLGDDNVHAQNTLQLVERSLKAGCTTLETMLYPDVGHGLGGAKADMVRRQLAFFEKHLK